MNFGSINFTVLLILSFFVSGCNSSSDSSGTTTAHTIFVSNNNANDRAIMTVTGTTTFAEINTFAATNLSSVAGRDFELMVAGKTPAGTDLLSDHGFSFVGNPSSTPMGNVVVKIK